MPLLTLPTASAFAPSGRAKALLFEDPKSRRLLESTRTVARIRSNVLITGETGTGKELVARYVHELSENAKGPFVVVNCGALSDPVAPGGGSGFEEGMSESASNRRDWFEAAEGGTLFLDQVCDLPFGVQTRLLHVFQDGEIARVGVGPARPVNVRLIVGTNVSLEAAVAAGRFRGDLFYRLNVAPLDLPPLRERPGDILPLARHFLEVYRERLGARPAATLDEEAEARLLEHSWPGNIRELENAIHYALLVCPRSQIGPGDLRLSSLRPEAAMGAPEASLLDSALIALFEQGPEHLFEHIEETVIVAAYRYCDKNQLQTARLLGISRNIVRARLIQFGEIPGMLRSSSTGLGQGDSRTKIEEDAAR